MRQKSIKITKTFLTEYIRAFESVNDTVTDFAQNMWTSSTIGHENQ